MNAVGGIVRACGDRKADDRTGTDPGPMPPPRWSSSWPSIVGVALRWASMTAVRRGRSSTGTYPPQSRSFQSAASGSWRCLVQCSPRSPPAGSVGRQFQNDCTCCSGAEHQARTRQACADSTPSSGWVPSVLPRRWSCARRSLLYADCHQLIPLQRQSRAERTCRQAAGACARGRFVQPTPGGRRHEGGVSTPVVSHWPMALSLFVGIGAYESSTPTRLHPPEEQSAIDDR